MAESMEAHFTLGMNLMRKMCTETKENFVFSPLSLGTAFAMLVAGLKGDTKEEVLGLLGCSDETAVHKMYVELIKDKNLPLKIANKYLAHHECKVQKEFDELLKEKYESEVEVVNFAADSSKIENQVNEWVASKTNDMIKTLLQPGTLTPDTVFVLLNAVYFKGTWCKKFDPVPQQMDFKLRDGTKVKKDFMTKESSDFMFFKTEHLKMVRIPYLEGGCYMVVAIPSDEDKHIDEIMATMTAAEMAKAVEGLNKAKGPKVVLTMPKFKIDYKYGNIIEHMKTLGVSKIFQGGVGDFGGIFESMPKKVYVSDIVHQAMIDVDEKGTEAAAATAMNIMLCALPPRSRPPINVTLNRPFAFFLSAKDNCVCFVGLCNEPQKKNH